MTYKGTAVFEEQDEDAHRMVLIASGREIRGQGTARATVTGTLTGQDGGTAVSVRTDLAVTGRSAQFGRGVPAEVGDRLVGRFAACPAERLGEREAVPEAARPALEADGEPLDLQRAIGVPVAKRAAGAPAATAVVVVAVTRIRRRMRKV